MVHISSEEIAITVWSPSFARWIQLLNKKNNVKRCYLQRSRVWRWTAVTYRLTTIKCYSLRGATMRVCAAGFVTAGLTLKRFYDCVCTRCHAVLRGKSRRENEEDRTRMKRRLVLARAREREQQWRNAYSKRGESVLLWLCTELLCTIRHYSVRSECKLFVLFSQFARSS